MDVYQGHTVVCSAFYPVSTFTCIVFLLLP